MSLSMRLSEDLVRHVHRDITDAGPASMATTFTETDYDEHLKAFLAERPVGPVKVFSYGSLIWKPVFEPSKTTRASAIGWNRAFCLRMVRFRGTHDQPGLMMQIDRGTRCDGILQEVHAGREWIDLSTLWRREMTVKPPGNFPRWIEVDIHGTRSSAIAFTANPQSPNYVGGLQPDQIAETLATACGHWGSGADYLRQTIIALANAGIHDPYLWDLQDRVANRIEHKVKL